MQDVHAQWTPIEAHDLKKTSINMATILHSQVQSLMQLWNGQSFLDTQTAIPMDNEGKLGNANVIPTPLSIL